MTIHWLCLFIITYLIQPPRPIAIMYINLWSCRLKRGGLANGDLFEDEVDLNNEFGIKFFK